MKILIIAPILPQVAGHALAAEVFFDDLAKTNKVEVVNLNKVGLKDGEA